MCMCNSNGSVCKPEDWYEHKTLHIALPSRTRVCLPTTAPAVQLTHGIPSPQQSLHPHAVFL